MSCKGTCGGDRSEYTYDALNRPVREYEHDTNQSAEYAYAHLGNRILEKDNRDTLHYTYNELNRLVQKKAFNGVSTYEYDKRGNRTKIEYHR